MSKQDVYPDELIISSKRKETVVFWSDKTKTVATANGNDKFNVELGVLWALSKKFISTSKIVNSVFAATYFLGMTEGEMLWIIATKFMSEKDVEQVIEFGKQSIK